VLRPAIESARKLICASCLSSRVGAQTVVDDRAFAPYGELYNNFGSTAANENMFTGDTQDILATGNCCYDTPNRELSGNQGRWLSPDPAGAGWNAYAYATNPNSNVDPTGLAGCKKDIPGCDSGGAPGTGGYGYDPLQELDEFGTTNLVFYTFYGLTAAGTVAADSGAGSSTATSTASASGVASSGQLCFCADDVTSGALGNPPPTLPDLGPSGVSSSLTFGVDGMPAGIQVVGLMFQYNGPNSYTDSDGNLQYVAPGAPYDATVVVNVYSLQVVNADTSPLQGNFTVTEYGMSAYGNSVSPQSAGLQVEYTWVTNSNGSFPDPVGYIGPSANTYSQLNVINYAVDGAFVPTTNIQTIHYNNGSLSTSMYGANYTP